MASLTEYRRKRHFAVTPEPSGKPAPKKKASASSFVVQKHDATRLHYDLRLEIEGVLKSWAVPKGPSLNPADKRLAMQTEDHPLEYRDFEGLIPQGQYGAGPMIVWDRGTFQTEGDTPVQEQLEKGELKFVLSGERLKGSFVLVKLRRSEQKGKPWLLIKHKDEAADPRWRIEQHERSVISGRTLKEIKEPEVRSQKSGEKREPSRDRQRAVIRTNLEAHRPSLDDPAKLQGTRKAKLPAQARPTLATLARKPFSHPDWLFEVKWDGVRALAWIEDGQVEMRSRRTQIVTDQFPELTTLPERLRAQNAIVDGEIVVLDKHGRSDFQRLQPRINNRSPSRRLLQEAPVTYFLFDILYCDGYDLREVRLIERKDFLRSVFAPEPPFAFADHQMEEGEELFKLARQQGLEGIIGKEIHSYYSGNRSRDWMKFKITRDLHAVVGGYTAPRGSREHFGALLVGLYEGSSLRFIGGVGTGFNYESQKLLYDQLEELKTSRCPFQQVPRTNEKAEWVKPEMVARVNFARWTSDRRLRAPVFLGLVADHPPEQCRFDTKVAELG